MLRFQKVVLLGLIVLIGVVVTALLHYTAVPYQSVDTVNKTTFDYAIVDNPNTGMVDIYINNEIGTASNYSGLFIYLNNYTGTKPILLRLNIRGGVVMTGLMLKNALQKLRVPVYTYVDGWAFSLGAVLTMLGKKIYIEDDSIVMFHNISRPGTPEVPAPIQQSYKILLWEAARTLLTLEEFNAATSPGGEVWLSGPELKKRLCNLHRLGGTEEYVKKTCAAVKSWPKEKTIYGPSI